MPIAPLSWTSPFGGLRGLGVGGEVKKTALLPEDIAP